VNNYHEPPKELSTTARELDEIAGRHSGGIAKQASTGIPRRGLTKRKKVSKKYSER
jgi:hypothetical protein